MTPSPAAAAGGPYLVFGIGGDDNDERGGAYALEVSSVFQVIEPPGVSAVPLAPAVILGIINHHGRIVTVIDPAPLLGLAAQGGSVAQAVILRQGLRGPANLGLQVASIQGIVTRSELTLVEVGSGPCVVWVARAGRRLVHVLALDPLLERLSRLFGSLDSRPSVQGVTV